MQRIQFWHSCVGDWMIQTLLSDICLVCCIARQCLLTMRACYPHIGCIFTCRQSRVTSIYSTAKTGKNIHSILQVSESLPPDHRSAHSTIARDSH